MPAPAPTYVERLSVRRRWWVVVIAIALFGGLEVSAGLDWIGTTVTLGLALLVAGVLLLGVGRTVVRVDAGGVHVAGRTMTFDEMESAEGLDRERTRLQLGPAADPAALLVVRGFIPQSVLIRPLDPRPTPYWLVSTRHPAEFVAAVEMAARAYLNR
jgi:hypothetical protein